MSQEGTGPGTSASPSADRRQDGDATTTPDGLTDDLRDGQAQDIDQVDTTGGRVLDLAALERADATGSWRVDLTAPLAPPAGRDLRRRLRTWQVLAAVATVLAVAGGLIAGVTARRGEEWRQIAVGQQGRAAALEDHLQAATAAVAAAEQVAAEAETARREAEAAREQVDGLLAAQEQDLVALEERVAALAAEKARLEDRLVVAGQARRLTSSADASLVGCVQQIESWLARAPAEAIVADAEATATAASAVWASWGSEAPAWRASCADALASARG